MAKKQNKSFQDQYDDEEMQMMFRKHPVVMRRQLIIASVMLLLGTIPTYVVSEPTLTHFFGGLAVGAFFGTLVMLYGWIGWYYSVFIVTDQRFIQISQKGLFNRSVVDIALNQIQMVNYSIKGLQETLLGYGTLSVQTMVGELTINEVHKPAHVQKDLNQVLRKHVQGVVEIEEEE